METSESKLMKIHRLIPCIKGFTPTDLNFLMDSPLPIKNRVIVNPFLAIITNKLYVDAYAGT